MTYPRDVLAEHEQQRRAPRYPEVAARIGDVVEDRSSGFCGDIVKITNAAVTLRDRRGNHRHFGFKPGGFLREGKPVTLVRDTARPEQAAPLLTNSGSIVARGPTRAQVARASRIWVEGRHDAELLEHVWGDDLRELGIVVEPLHGLDHVLDAVAAFAPGPGRRLGILVDHLVTGSKEQRLTASIGSSHVLVTGHPFVDVWEGVRPKVVGLAAWPRVPRGQPWKEGMCRALGTDLDGFWPRLRNSVRTFADLSPELVGAVDRLIDFVAE
jgi:hypothetical protein